jgi:hypothetical protein
MVQLSFADAEAAGVDGEDAAGLVADDHMLSVGATGQAHEAQPQQPSFGANDNAHVGQSVQHGTGFTPSVEDFIAGLKLPLEVPLIRSPSCLRVSRVRVEGLVSRRSDRLAAKSAFRVPNPEKQAKRVLVGKWQPSASAPRSATTTSDAAIAVWFHETFREPLSSSKRETVQELFPMAGARRRRAAAHAP